MKDYEKEYINGCIAIIESCEPVNNRIKREAFAWLIIYGSMTAIILGMVFCIIRYLL